MVNESDAWRHSNMGRLLNNAVRRYESRVFDLLAEAGHTETRLSHLHLTRNLDIRGTRVTELARRAAMTKQAMSELVAQCEKLGLVRRVPDPRDARAKIVAFTARGIGWLQSFKTAISRAEHEMRQELGTLRVDGLAAALHLYASACDSLENGIKGGAISHVT
jgi:DNA-binding MarR family transcriptional regulator